jgi:hypothetical protein
MSGTSAAVVDGIYARFPDEGEHQQPWKSESLGITKVSQPDGHAFMACGWRPAIGSEEAIPPWEVEAEIAVGFISDDGVVDPMHFRCNHQEAEYPI